MCHRLAGRGDDRRHFCAYSRATTLHQQQWKEARAVRQGGLLMTQSDGATMVVGVTRKNTLATQQAELLRIDTVGPRYLLM